MGRVPRMALVKPSNELRTHLSLMGGSITNASSLITAISEKTKVEMFEIQESDVTVIEKNIPRNIFTVPGTMKLQNFTRYANLNISV